MPRTLCSYQTEVHVIESRSVQILETHGTVGTSWYFPGLESHGIRPRSLKVLENQPNDCCIFDPCNCFQPYHCLLSDAVQHGLTMLSSNTVRLQSWEIFGKVTITTRRAILTGDPNCSRNKIHVQTNTESVQCLPVKYHKK